MCSRLLNVDYERIGEITASLCCLMPEEGFEFYPFKVGWYNECVQKAFALPYDADTVAYIVLSTPAMFENYFIPFIREEILSARDPIDECVRKHLEHIMKNLSGFDIDVIQDFELTPTRRPKVLVQTAGHVSGAVYYYQRSDVENDPWDKNKRICGVSVHPKYGGWFGFRGVIILRNVLCSNLPRIQPLDVLHNDNAKKIELLTKFNFHWEDWSFRDVVTSRESYSEQQRSYFSAKPSERKQWIEQLMRR